MKTPITVVELETQLPEILSHVRPEDRPDHLNPQGDALRAFALDCLVTWYEPSREWEVDDVAEEVITRMAEALAVHFEKDN